MGQLRYRFRLYPEPGRRMALAQSFGNARVVYNDAVRARQDAYRAGEKFPSSGVLQKRLITDSAAKNILAAGRAERPNACGPDVRPATRPVGDEAGPQRSAA